MASRPDRQDLQQMSHAFRRQDGTATTARHDTRPASSIVARARAVERIILTGMNLVPLPLDYGAIESILPHRYPFLLVDRITELEPDKRIVGIKNVSNLPTRHSGKQQNRQKLPFFMGIDRVRYRRAVYPGDVIEIEARVKRLRKRVGQLEGLARVNGRIVVKGTMTFALGSASSSGPKAEL